MSWDFPYEVHFTYLEGSTVWNARVCLLNSVELELEKRARTIYHLMTLLSSFYTTTSISSHRYTLHRISLARILYENTEEYDVVTDRHRRGLRRPLHPPYRVHRFPACPVPSLASSARAWP